MTGWPAGVGAVPQLPQQHDFMPLQLQDFIFSQLQRLTPKPKHPGSVRLARKRMTAPPMDLLPIAHPPYPYAPLLNRTFAFNQDLAYCPLLSL
jgi:hypothetical protein